MNSFLDDLTLEQLDSDALDLAELISIDAFKKIVEVYGGSGSLYIPSFATLRAGLRNQKLVQDYQAGLKVKHLTRKYHVSESLVYKIIRDYKAQEAAQDG